MRIILTMLFTMMISMAMAQDSLKVQLNEYAIGYMKKSIDKQMELQTKLQQKKLEFDELNQQYTDLAGQIDTVLMMAVEAETGRAKELFSGDYMLQPDWKTGLLIFRKKE